MSAELAWAAGFFDGEGTTQVIHPGKSERRPDGYATLLMAIKQIDRRPLDRFNEAVELGNVTGPYRSKSERERPQWSWQVGGQETERVLYRLWPWLSEPKREQAERCIDRVQKDRHDRPRIDVGTGGIQKPKLRSLIAELTASGCSPREIVQRTGLSRSSVYYHLRLVAKGVV